MILKNKISVVVSMYNAQKFIGRTLSALIDSILKTEVIVVDDGSTDRSLDIIKGFKCRVIKLVPNRGRQRARLEGMRAARGKIVVNVDSDVVVYPDVFEKISKYFELHPGVDAITGRLAKEHPNNNFASQYKNLYMNYYFGLLSERVNFLYGSIFALRKKVVDGYLSEVKKADDTDLGLYLNNRGKVIHLVKDLEVVHLKKYNLWLLIKNDFEIPYDWAFLFWKHKGWTGLFRNGTGFVHASKGQLGSLVVSFWMLVISLLIFTRVMSWIALIPLILLWVVLNWDFLQFLTKEKGWWFGMRAFLFTFFDYYVMGVGIGWGTLNYWWKKLELRVSGGS